VTDLWVSGKRSHTSSFRSPSPMFADPRREAYQHPFPAMSADILLTSNSKAGCVVTHKPGSDLHVYP
jgi:hypothetical protein